jgi:hypothetical protein
MKQTTKVLLPLGLLMSIVIPLTVRALLTDADFVGTDNNTNVDYLQPYQIPPESSVTIPNSDLTSENLKEKIHPGHTGSYKSKEQAKSYIGSNKRIKIDIPLEEIPPNVKMQLETRANRLRSTADLYK